ncbi:MAG TPA: hypothetical protein PLL33_05440 [Paracoccus sp. (in: a-proteobacteria)]|nr:hypothetical protein [Paracoccus sp. (in: a-proteobacteria)]
MSGKIGLCATIDTLLHMSLLPFSTDGERTTLKARAARLEEEGRAMRQADLIADWMPFPKADGGTAVLLQHTDAPRVRARSDPAVATLDCGQESDSRQGRDRTAHGDDTEPHPANRSDAILYSLPIETRNMVEPRSTKP